MLRPRAIPRWVGCKILRSGWLQVGCGCLATLWQAHGFPTPHLNGAHVMLLSVTVSLLLLLFFFASDFGVTSNVCLGNSARSLSLSLYEFHGREDVL